MNGPSESDLSTTVLQSLNINSVDSGVGDDFGDKPDGKMLHTAIKASTWTDMKTGQSHGHKSIKMAPKFQTPAKNEGVTITRQPRRHQYGFVSTSIQGGSTIPHVYQEEAPKPTRLDFHGSVLPQRSPDEEFQRPVRFAAKREAEYGKEITHESHRFLFTKQLWPSENRDHEIEKYRQQLPGGPLYSVNRIYDDPHQPDLAFKVQDKRRWNKVVSNEKERNQRVSQTSRRRKSLSGT